jgi:putative hemolysin
MDMSERMDSARKRSRDLLPGIVILFCILGTLACGCTQPSDGTATPTPTATTPGMANPAAVACKAANLTYEIRTNTTDGSQYGVCIMKDGTVCDEWAYFRKECPAPAVTTPGTGMANPSAVYCEEQNLTYEIRTNTDGSQSGVCILADGTECDGWEYYRGDCPAPATMPGAGIANPSAVYCEGQNLTYEIRTNPDGSQSGVCILANGTECDGWAYYRDECP